MKQQSLKRCPIGIQTFEEIMGQRIFLVGKLSFKRIA